MVFELTLLGTNGALPAYGRFPTAQILDVHHVSYLIDCGEGTQMRMQEFHRKNARLQHIFISHLHGDHCFGLIGLLTSLNLIGRKDPMDIFSPPGLQGMIEAQLKPTGTVFQFPVRFHEVDPTQHAPIHSDPFVRVHTIPLEHRIPCCGYRFDEHPRERSMRKEKIAEYDLTIPQIKAAKAGHDIHLDDGRTIPVTELTDPPPPARSFAFCSDTVYLPELVTYIKGVDLLYHESTFCEEFAERAAETKHSTARQAAQLAEAACAGTLILGHYSSRYPEVDVFEEEAKSVFSNAVAGRDGQRFSVPYGHRRETD
jgi:ribonuclease Z